jgi:hypothetical protein
MANGKSFFHKEQVTTYSHKLLLKLDDDLLRMAQDKIYSKKQASSSDLSVEQQVNSVVDALAIPKNSDSERFQMALAFSFYQLKNLHPLRVPTIRLSEGNYEKVKLISDLIKHLDKDKDKEEKPFEIPIIRTKELIEKEMLDLEFSAAINTILILFKSYDIGRDTMDYIGMSK